MDASASSVAPVFLAYPRSRDQASGGRTEFQQSRAAHLNIADDLLILVSDKGLLETRMSSLTACQGNPASARAFSRWANSAAWHIG
eukprot:6986881-Alexandrium_andersonii.AAC.1